MIQKSFIFLPKINKKTEENIWNQGITSWSKFLESKRIKGISKIRKVFLDSCINRAKIAYRNSDISWFKENWPSSETWRLYDYFKDECCFIDIEGDINIIGIFDGYQTRTMIRHINFDKRILRDELNKYKLIITYNGGSYDLPKLEKYFNLSNELIHIDLKTACRRIGLIGGLKLIEKELSIKRSSHLYGSAASCYRTFLASGKREWLEGLVEYNEQDCMSLKTIIEYCYLKLSRI